MINVLFYFLGGVAYDIISANIEYVPSGHYVDIESQKEEDAFRKLIDLLNENEIVTGVYHNCTLDTANWSTVMKNNDNLFNASA